MWCVIYGICPPDIGIHVYVYSTVQLISVALTQACPSEQVFPIPTGVAAILAQFPNHFHSIAWFNVILGIVCAFLQLVMLRGESRCQCENPCQTHKCSLPDRSKFRRMMTCSNLSLILVSLRWLVTMVTSVHDHQLVEFCWVFFPAHQPVNEAKVSWE